jgi:hypothetical protein
MIVTSRSSVAWRLALLAAPLVAPFSPARGQERGEPLLEAPATWSIAPYVGIARNSPAGTSWGVTPDRDHLFLGVHLATPVLRVGPVVLSYAPNLVPLVVVSGNPRTRTIAMPEGRPPETVVTGRGTVVGAGFSPLGLQLALRPGSRIDAYAAGAVGGLWFADRVPSPNSRRFNLTLEWGGGVGVRLDERRAIQVGYKFHHLSNLYTAPANPGLDGNVFYAGFSWSLRRSRDDAASRDGT